MWTMNQIMEAGAMGVQITISGKLRGDRSAFEKHTRGILPRAGNYAKNLVTEDIVHTKTPMGLIGIKIRIAEKEKIVHEFEFNEKQNIVSETDDKTDKEKITARTESETDDKTDKEKITARTESEQIKIEEEKMKTLVTLEEEEAKMK